MSNEDVCNLAFIPDVNAEFNVDCEDVNEFKDVKSAEDDENPKDVICAEELITLLPFVSNDDVTDSKDDNLSLSNMFTREVTASANVSNSIL
jgi:hypothetical protein